MMETQTCAGLVSALEGRAAFYDVVAALYYKPLAQEQIDRIAEGGLAAFAGAGELMAEGLHDMERALSKRHSGTRQELAVDFTAPSPGRVVERRYATPYESVFTGEERIMMGDARDDVVARFLEDGFQVNPDLHEPEDHLAFELEYLVNMNERALEWAQAKNKAQLRRNVVRQLEFIEQHLLNWIPALLDVRRSTRSSRSTRACCWWLRVRSSRDATCCATF